MIKIGIDPSINCTGICVWDTDRDIHCYYMIPSKVTKKMSIFQHDFIRILPYIKQDIKNLEYSEKEKLKFDQFEAFSNFYEIF